jgi:hypothetical protein
MANLEPENFEFEKTDETTPDGSKKSTTKWALGTEDIVVLGGVAVAILVTLGMIFGVLPINNYTYGLAGLSAFTSLVVKIMKKPKGK